MPIDIVIYAIVAAVMVFWLRSVLGTRHGEERQRPNPFDEKNMPEDIVDMSPKSKMPDVHAIKRDVEAQQDHGNASAGLVQIAIADRDFDTEVFKDNAKEAFIIIVGAFAAGDRDTLRDLCSDDVYDAFDQAIKTREDAGETVSTDIHAVRKVELTSATLEKKRHAYVSVRITADETYVIRDKKDNIIAGHPERITEMTDKWTFTRDVKSKDPRWFLCKTEDDEIEEDGKTPLPDAG